MVFSFPFIGLHHPGGVAPEDANFVQKAIDSETGVFFASLSHTFGALLFTAGIALYLYQARLVRIASEELEMPSVKWLPLAHILTVAGVGLNGIGGLMRLKQGDHPGLEELGASTPEGLWVTVLLVKHLFLVVGVGLAMLLTAGTFWLARKPNAPANFLPHANRMTASAVASFLTIIAATVFGVIAQGALAPMAPEANMEGMSMAQPGSLVFGTGDHYENQTGYITGNPQTPGRVDIPISIPTDTSRVWVKVNWTTAAASLDARLLDENATEIAAQKTPGAQRIEFLVEHDAIPSGTWTVVVTSTLAFPSEKFDVVVRKTVGALPVAEEQVAEKTFTVPAGGLDFVEINLNMKVGQSFRYEWSVVGSESQVHFDIHTHDNGNVEYPVNGNWNKYSGTYVHEKTEGASLFWTNSNPADVRVTYRIVGQFEIDSEVGTDGDVTII